MGRKEDVGGLIDYINDLRIQLSAREEVAREYKMRINSAIKYIKTQQTIFTDYDIAIENRLNILLNILNGESDKSKGE